MDVASILGLLVAGFVPSYAASKAGFVQLASYDIRFNALCARYMETDLGAVDLLNRSK